MAAMTSREKRYRKPVKGAFVARGLRLKPADPGHNEAPLTDSTPHKNTWMEDSMGEMRKWGEFTEAEVIAFRGGMVQALYRTYEEQNQKMPKMKRLESATLIANAITEANKFIEEKKKSAAEGMMFAFYGGK